MHNTTTPLLVDKSILSTTSVPGTVLFGTTAIKAVIHAGCSPVRMVETTGANPTLWVSVRGDNRLLAFDTAKLAAETPADTQGTALLGTVASGGQAPVGLALFGGEKFLAVANSNRFNAPAPGNVALFQVSRAANGTTSASLVDTLDAQGVFPREINVGADDATLYVTNYESDNFLVIPTSLTSRR